MNLSMKSCIRKLLETVLRVSGAMVLLLKDKNIREVILKAIIQEVA